MKTVGVTGGSGFIGRHLTEVLLAAGYEVIVFSRQIPEVAAHERLLWTRWDPGTQTMDTTALGKLHALVHLAGAGIADKRWTAQRKQEIFNSRVEGTRFIVTQLKEHAPLCTSFVSISATGYYGPDRPGHKPFTEQAPHGNDFLAATCMAWEAEALMAAATMRTVILRLGIVLGKGGGAYPSLARPLSFGIMAVPGNGNQVTSWIGLSDLCRMILFALQQQGMSGIYNAVSPRPVPYNELMQTIAAVKGSRIAIPLHLPPAILKLAIGEMSSDLLSSCTVSAQKISDAGFRFQSPDIRKTIEMIVTE